MKHLPYILALLITLFGYWPKSFAAPVDPSQRPAISRNSLLLKFLKDPFPPDTPVKGGYKKPKPYLWEGMVWAIEGWETRKVMLRLFMGTLYDYPTMEELMRVFGS